jgi:NADH-quinone oxidoreductase subunit E
MSLSESTRVQAREIISRYPQARSALLPMLHLVQSEEGYVSADGIALCADAIWEKLSSRLGIGHDEVTPDGKISLERIECQAACTHAPVMTANWEFLDNMTPESAIDVVEKLASGKEVISTRGPKIRTFKENELTLAGFDDGLFDEGVQADEQMLAGLNRAKELGQTAPGVKK